MISVVQKTFGSISVQLAKWLQGSIISTLFCWWSLKKKIRKYCISAKPQFLKRERERKRRRKIRWMMLNPNGNLNKNVINETIHDPWLWLKDMNYGCDFIWVTDPLTASFAEQLTAFFHLFIFLAPEVYCSVHWLWVHSLLLFLLSAADGKFIITKEMTVYYLTV